MPLPAYASGIILGAALGDRFGRPSHLRPWVLDFSPPLPLRGALFGHPEQLIAARVVQGIGAAIVMP